MHGPLVSKRETERPRRAPLDCQPSQVHLPPRRRVHFHQVLRMVRDNRDPVTGHRVAPRPVPLQVLNVRRRVHVLQPFGDPEQNGPARAGETEVRGC